MCSCGINLRPRKLPFKENAFIYIVNWKRLFLFRFINPSKDQCFVFPKLYSLPMCPFRGCQLLLECVDRFCILLHLHQSADESMFNIQPVICIAATHWLLNEAYDFFIYFSNWLYELITWILSLKLVLGECHRTQYWIRYCHGDARQQTITWAIVDIGPVFHLLSWFK